MTYVGHPGYHMLFKKVIVYTRVVTVQESQSGKSNSLILDLPKNVQKSPIKGLKEQNIHDRKKSSYAYHIVNIGLKLHSL